MTGPSGHTPPPSEGTGGAFVRRFVVTRGRVHARHWLSPETLLEAGPGRGGPGLAEGEYQQMTQLCRERHRSVAELAGTVRLPLSTARVLISDLVDAQVLRVSLTASHTSTDSPAGNRPSRQQLLEALRAGITRKWSDAEAKAC
ncbi:DUF742 domain-containing protein [Streptomyces lanatus]|uniref:DUF742 domain-containing protein n=1 Tax=Streptomyces lanatus TaxID=66900 RepID=A0ABV1Y025_9ACTN|nr:DUF742 domain-containing protein [Streptomyces lanatus]GHH22166.1 hypothetical protein GCM10018780_70350 [Streptomyces lanatus]